MRYFFLLDRKRVGTKIKARTLSWILKHIDVFGFAVCVFKKRTASAMRKIKTCPSHVKSALSLILTITEREVKCFEKCNYSCKSVLSALLNADKSKFLFSYCKSTDPRVSNVETQIIKMRILLYAGCVYYSSCDNFKAPLH